MRRGAHNLYMFAERPERELDVRQGDAPGGVSTGTARSLGPAYAQRGATARIESRWIPRGSNCCSRNIRR